MNVHSFWHLVSVCAFGFLSYEITRSSLVLLKGYGAQSAEEKQRLFKLMRNLNFNGESGAELHTPTAQTSGVVASDGLYSPEFRGDFGAGLLDLHAMDDTELLSEVWFLIGNCIYAVADNLWCKKC